MRDDNVKNIHEVQGAHAKKAKYGVINRSVSKSQMKRNTNKESDIHERKPGPGNGPELHRHDDQPQHGNTGRQRRRRRFHREKAADL